MTTDEPADRWPAGLRPGERVALAATTDPSRRHLVGRAATVALVGRSGAAAAVVFDGLPGRWTVCRGIDALAPLAPPPRPVRIRPGR